MDSCQKKGFEKDGFVRVERLFSEAEISVLMNHLGDSYQWGERTSTMNDSQGRGSKLSLWCHTPDDVFGRLSRHPRIVLGAQALLGEDVYHWHSKIMFKEPRKGGAWEWHQDYGYWYGDGCLYPRLISCMIALDPATQANGCLQVLSGSHLLGRLDHSGRGGQAGADPERVAQVEKRLPMIYCTLNPGDALFFHGNLLHCSGPNCSDIPRRAFISCFNAWSNIPIEGRGHGKPERIQLVEDDVLLKVQA